MSETSTEETDAPTAEVNAPTAETDAPIEETPAEEAAVEETPVEETPAEEISAKEEEAATEEVAEEEAVEEDELIYERPEEEDKPKVRSSYDRPGKWYVVTTTSGHEKVAKANLETRTQTMNVAEKIFEVVIPEEEQVEFKGTKKEVVKKKLFPGYLLVRCMLDDETWLVVRNTPGITGFTGPDSKPSALSRTEVETFLGDKSEGEHVRRKVRPRLSYEIGETVRIKEGPFKDSQGEIMDVNEDQLKITVLIDIFGRDTPVEVEFAQVSKQ